MHDSSQNYTDILLEQIRDQNQAVLEAVASIRQTVENQPTRDEFNELRDDVRVVKVVLTEHSTELKGHEQRITRLETRTA